MFESLLVSANPWWKGSWGPAPPPEFKRPIFEELLADLFDLKQILSLTGPRRIGKTTLLKQLIRHLIEEKGLEPRNVVYLSLDDPALSTLPEGKRIFDALVERYIQAPEGKPKNGLKVPVYFFLDEVQRIPRWELYLKKYFDLGYPIRWIVTGSASSPILRKSQESLLGRIRQHHLLPFSFHEYALYKHQDNPNISHTIKESRLIRSHFFHYSDVGDLAEKMKNTVKALIPHRELLEKSFREYLLYGGFPEVWEIADPQRRMEYLFDNQIRKVIFEDLYQTTSFRKPENIQLFFLHLLGNPGTEIQVDKISNTLRVSRIMLERYLPLLEMTDLINHIERFSKKTLKVKRGLFKCYVIDLALRNSIYKVYENLFNDTVTLGRYAENLVYLTLKRWKEAIHIAYWRERDREVDFVATLSADQHLPIEVKWS
ncbi:MAG: ATP-binding protein, partial [bacterium]